MLEESYKQQGRTPAKVTKPVESDSEGVAKVEPPTPQAPFESLTRPKTTGALYGEMQVQQRTMLNKNKRDHIKEITSIFSSKKSNISVAASSFQYNEEWKEHFKQKEYEHHLKRDKFTEYTEALARHKKLLKK
jgi:hypothetical protein